MLLSKVFTRTVQEIGRGNQGTVFKVRLPRCSAAVAAKLHSISHARFEAANIFPLCDHPNLLTIKGFFCNAIAATDGEAPLPSFAHPCFAQITGEDKYAAISVYEYVPRGSLKKILDQGLSPRTRMSILRGVALGLLHLHRNGILHLDVKPDNVLLDHHFVPRIADFGCAINLRTCSAEEAAQMTGTRRYRAPEIGRMAADHKADVYSFGMLACDLVSSDMDSRLVHLLRWCTRQNPTERPSMADCLSQLETLLFS